MSASFVDAIERERNYLTQYCRNRLYRKEDAEDVVQEAIVAAWCARLDFPVDGLIDQRKWLTSFVRNACFNWQRKMNWEHAGIVDPNIRARFDTESEALTRIDLAQMAAALPLLSPLQRAVVCLRCMDGMKSKDIDFVLNLPRNAATKHLMDARVRLRRYMDNPATIKGAHTKPIIIDALKRDMAAHAATSGSRLLHLEKRRKQIPVSFGDDDFPGRDLTDEEWKCAAPLFVAHAGSGNGRTPKNPRGVLDGILWALRTDAPWRDLPVGYPPYTTCETRFRDWTKDGKLSEALSRIVINREMEATG